MCVCVCAVDLLFVSVRDIYICSTLNLSLQCVSLFLLLFVLFFASDANCVCVLSSRFFCNYKACIYTCISLSSKLLCVLQMSAKLLCVLQMSAMLFCFRYGVVWYPERERERERALLHLFSFVEIISFEV